VLAVRGTGAELPSRIRLTAGKRRVGGTRGQIGEFVAHAVTAN